MSTLLHNTKSLYHLIVSWKKHTYLIQKDPKKSKGTKENFDIFRNLKVKLKYMPIQKEKRKIETWNS